MEFSIKSNVLLEWWICGFSRGNGTSTSCLEEIWALRDGLTLASKLHIENFIIKLVVRFFLFARFFFSAAVVDYSSVNSVRQWLFFSQQCVSVGPCTVDETYKLYFSATFSLKIGLTVLFTHLKIILLSCF